MSNSTSDKQWLAGSLVCFIRGIFGDHRFYVGNTQRYLGYVAYLILILTITTGCSQGTDDNSSPEALAKTLLHAIKTGDQALFDKHLMTPDEDIYLDTLNTLSYSNESWYAKKMEGYERYIELKNKHKFDELDEDKKIEFLSLYLQLHPDTILAEQRKKSIIEIASKSSNAFYLKERFKKYGLTDWSNVEFKNFSFKFVRDGHVTNNNKSTFRNGDYVGEITMPAFIKAPDGTWRFHNFPYYSSYEYVN